MLNDMFQNIEKNIENSLNNNLTTNVENMQVEQNTFLSSKIGQAINGGINIALKAILPDVIEDEIIHIKDSLITEGFSAAIDTAVKEAINFGKSITGMITGNFENISQIKNAIEKGGLVDSVSSLIDTGINWANNKGYINNEITGLIKAGKNTIMGTIEKNIDNTFTNQTEMIEIINGYIDKWYSYYEKQDFNNMTYQYNKIMEYLDKIVPLEEIINKARMVENIHELIKNNGKNFDITEQEKELAKMLAV